MRLGFVGCGTIARAMVEGLRFASDERPIMLSPRNAQIAADLARRFPGVELAASNQDVVEASDVVVLAVRPQVADELLPGLRFRPDQQVVSLIAAVSLDYLRSATAPAKVTRAVPVPAVARGEGPTAIYPPNPIVSALFAPLGTPIELHDEAEFDVFTAATAIMASYFAFAGTVTSWMERQGVGAANAQAFAGTLLKGLAGTAAAHPHRSFPELEAEHRTAGGLNEQVLQAIGEGGLLTDLDQGLDAVLRRLRAAAR